MVPFSARRLTGVPVTLSNHGRRSQRPLSTSFFVAFPRSLRTRGKSYPRPIETACDIKKHLSPNSGGV